MEIDVRDESEITTIRFSEWGEVSKLGEGWFITVDHTEDDGYEIDLDEIDDLIKALKKLKEITK